MSTYLSHTLALRTVIRAVLINLQTLITPLVLVADRLLCSLDPALGPLRIGEVRKLEGGMKNWT